MATCTYQTPFGYRCPLEEADATGLCILHTKNESKDGTAFMEALRGKIRHDVEDTAAQEVRLDGVVFPGPLVWVEVVRGLPTIAKPISFQGAAFSGAANFWGATFTGAADFTGATFTGAADFSSATFTGAANFSWAAFTRDAGFWEATFKGRTLFQHTVFPTEEAKGSVDFQEIAIEKPEEFFFEDVALSRVPFLRTNLARVQLTDITWARKPERFTPWVRHNVVYDHLEMEQEEKSHKEQGKTQGKDESSTPDEGEEGQPDRQERENQNKARLIANLYRQLRLNYEGSKQEVEAGHFYIGQMDMRRRDPETGWFTRWLALPVYRAIAMYGESAWRPLLLYFLTSVVFAALYLYAGFYWGDQHEQVNYALTRPGAFFPFGGDFLKAWYLALTAGSLLRGNAQVIAYWGLIVAYLNMVLDVFLIALFVIALRRHFRR